MMQNSPDENKVVVNSDPTPVSNNSVIGQTQEQLQNVGQAMQNQAAGLTNAVQGQVSGLGQAGMQGVQDLGKAGAQGVQDLGKAGGQVIQNLGQTGVNQVNSFVGQFTKPLTSSAVEQPPVLKDEKIYGGLCYVPFFAIVAVILKPDSAFVRLHAKQGILLTIIFMFVGILAAVVSIFGVLGSILSFLIGLVPMASLFVGLYSMYLAFTGYWWKIPVLSSVADLIPIELIAKTSKENLSGQVGIAKADYDNRKDALGKESAQNVAVPNSVPSVASSPTVPPTQSEIQKK